MARHCLRRISDFLESIIGGFRSRMLHVVFFLMIAAIAAAAGLMILACHRPLKGVLEK
jgi:hypothetical protein